MKKIKYDAYSIIFWVVFATASLAGFGMIVVALTALVLK